VNDTWPPDEHGDERPISNHSANPRLDEVLAADRPPRRAEGLDSASSRLFGSTVLAGGVFRSGAGGRQIDALGFKPVAVGLTDAIVVPEGYRADVLIPLGEPITGNMPAFALENSADDQANQIGMHHDGMHFFPIDGSSEEGLLVLNPEYVEPRWMHASMATANSIRRGADRRRRATPCPQGANTASASFTEETDGTWAVAGSLNRRITALTRHLRRPGRRNRLSGQSTARRHGHPRHDQQLRQRPVELTQENWTRLLPER
jgi:hypothetical protein